MIGLERIRGTIFNVPFFNDGQLVTQTSLDELPEWVQVGDLSVGCLQGRNKELVVEDYISNVAENFA